MTEADTHAVGDLAREVADISGIVGPTPVPTRAPQPDPEDDEPEDDEATENPAA